MKITFNLKIGKLYEIKFVMSIFKMVFFKIDYPMNVESVSAKYSAKK